MNAAALIVAVDGPSASGKSTVSRRAAAQLNCVYVDSGSLYRGLTWRVLRAGAVCSEAAAVERIMDAMRMDCFLDAGAVRFTIDGDDPGLALRAADVAERVSAVAALPRVRAWMVGRLRAMTRFGDLVMEGRDIGTVVFPETPFKFYLDADPAERARRRSLDFQAQQTPAEVTTVRRALERRDARDRARADAPLRVAAGARVIETTGLTVEQVVAVIVETVRQARDAAACGKGHPP